MTYADRCWTLVELVEFCVLRCDMMYLLLIKAGNEHSFMYRWLWSYKQYGHVCATKGSLDCDYTNSELLGGFPKGGGPQNGWFRNIMDKLDNLGVPRGTPIYGHLCLQLFAYFFIPFPGCSTLWLREIHSSSNWSRMEPCRSSLRRASDRSETVRKLWPEIW